MSPTATIQLTTMELVMGNPNILAISTGFCEGPCSVSSGVTDTALACTAVSADVAELSPAWAALALSAPRQITAAAKSDISLVFTSSSSPALLAGYRNRNRVRKPFATARLVADDHKFECTVEKPVERVQQLNTAPEISGFVK
jgi:hypothetical protein